MRIAIVGAGGRYKTERSLARAAASLGHRCRVVDVSSSFTRFRRLAAPVLRYRIESFEPEVIVLTSRAARLDSALIQRLGRRVRTCFWHIDLLLTSETWRLASAVQQTFVTCPPHIETLGQHGIQAWFLPQAADPFLDRPAQRVPASYRCEVSFIGSGQYPERHPTLLAAAAAARLQIRGPGWENAPPGLPVVGGAVRGRRFAQAVGGAPISLGANAYRAQARWPSSLSNRMWKVMGCGGFFLSEEVAGSEHFARAGEHCDRFQGPDELRDRMHHYLANSDERARIAVAGRVHTLAHHTYAHRLPLLLDGRGYTIS
jgi:spore maturation protein CgeB